MVAQCLGSGSTCPGCVDDSIDALFVGTDTVSCILFESTACTSIYENCNCGDCADEVDLWFDCSFADTDCGALECSAPVPAPVSAPVPAPVSAPVAAPLPVPVPPPTFQLPPSGPTPPATPTGEVTADTSSATKAASMIALILVPATMLI